MATSDYGDDIAIATLYLMAMMMAAVLTRLAFRFHMLRSLQWNDGTVSLALVFVLIWDASRVLTILLEQAFGVAQSSVMLAGTQHGLGKRESSLGPDQLSTVTKVNSLNCSSQD